MCLAVIILCSGLLVPEGWIISRHTEDEGQYIMQGIETPTGFGIVNPVGRQRSTGSTKQRSKRTKKHNPSTVPLMESCQHWLSFRRNSTDCSIRNAKTAKLSLSKARSLATFVISKPTSIPSYPMRNTRPIYTTTLYLPNPISTAVPNLRSDRRKPYACQAPKKRDKA